MVTGRVVRCPLPGLCKECLRSRAVQRIANSAIGFFSASTVMFCWLRRRSATQLPADHFQRQPGLETMRAARDPPNVEFGAGVTLPTQTAPHPSPRSASPRLRASAREQRHGRLVSDLTLQLMPGCRAPWISALRMTVRGTSLAGLYPYRLGRQPVKPIRVTSFRSSGASAPEYTAHRAAKFDGRRAFAGSLGHTGTLPATRLCRRPDFRERSAIMRPRVVNSCICNLRSVRFIQADGMKASTDNFACPSVNLWSAASSHSTRQRR